MRAIDDFLPEEGTANDYEMGKSLFYDQRELSALWPLKMQQGWIDARREAEQQQ